MSEATYTAAENAAVTAAIFEAYEVLVRIGATDGWLLAAVIDPALESRRLDSAHALSALWDERNKRETAARTEQKAAQAFDELHKAADKYGIDLNDPKTYQPREAVAKAGRDWFGSLDADRRCVCGHTRKEHADTPIATCWAGDACGCQSFKAAR